MELSIDDKSPRKTEIVKNTYQPKWNEEFTVLVNPRSVLLFRVLDHNSFRKDVAIGEKKFNLFQILTHYNGKCENLEVTLDLMSESKHDAQQVKIGELIALLNGLRLDMSALGRTSSVSGPLPLGPTNSESVSSRSVLNNGVKVRMRLHGSENVVPPLSQSVMNRQSVYPVQSNVPPVTNGAAVPLGPPPGVPNGVSVSPESHRNGNSVPEEPLPPGWEMRYVKSFL